MTYRNQTIALRSRIEVLEAEAKTLTSERNGDKRIINTPVIVKSLR